MTPARRLVITGTAAVAGAFIGLGGASITWWTVAGFGGSVETPGLGRALFPRQTVPVSGGDASGAVPMLLLLAGLAGVLAFVTGPRARAALFAVIPVLSGAAIVLALGISTPDAVAVARQEGFVGTLASIENDSTTGKVITTAGGLIAEMGALLAFPVARAVPRARIPEAGPAEGD